MTKEERFWSHIKVGSSEECWEWVGSRTSKGYGHVNYKGKTGGAHRVAFTLGGGMLTTEKPLILHSCDNPPCCNPKHLRAGSPAENTKDMLVKGRQAMGDRHGSRTHPEKISRGDAHRAKIKVVRGEQRSKKLCNANVLEIRRLRSWGEPLRTIGETFGVSDTTVSEVCRRKTWSHI